VEGGLYHVYNRAAHGAAVFADDAAATRFVDLLTRAVRRDGHLVSAWCVMTNHYHVVLRSGPVPLSRTFGFVQSRFGAYANRKSQTLGPRWQRRYQAKMVEDEGYLYQLIAYVHLNPVASGVVSDPADYRWSGHRELIGKEPVRMVDVERILELYGERKQSARAAYVRSLKGETESEWLGESPGRLPWWPWRPDRDLEPSPLPAWVDESGVPSIGVRRHLAPHRYLKIACRLAGADQEALASARRFPELGRQRELIIGLGIERWGQRPKQLGEVLGRPADTVGRWAWRASKRRQGDTLFRSAYDQLDRELLRETADDTEAGGESEEI
jgi:REP element-mobilizing transposase RayT